MSKEAYTSQPGTSPPIPPGFKDILWMPIPDGVTNVPPGLEYLALIDNLQIKQELELAEIVLGWETQNRYVISNGVGQRVYYAFEESDCCSRQCCAGARGFTLHIVDNFNKEVMRIIRPLMWCAGCCWCAVPGSCCSYELQVEAPPGNVIGRVQQRTAGCANCYVILNEEGQTVLDIPGPCCCAMLGCQDKIFEVHTTQAVKIGEIRKKWAGILQESFTSADNFGVSFPQDLSVKTKATLLGATFLIDFMNFERPN